MHVQQPDGGFRTDNSVYPSEHEPSGLSTLEAYEVVAQLALFRPLTATALLKLKLPRVRERLHCFFPPLTGAASLRQVQIGRDSLDVSTPSAKPH